jgi:uncharacterized protein (TIGR03437 family)
MYAFGLGSTSPQVSAGQATPSPAPTANGQFTVSFSYTGAALSLRGSHFPVANPAFVGLTPGQVGLYQVNFVIQPPMGVPSACDGPDQANLRVTLFSNQSPSFDTARICVQVPPQ